MLGRWFGLVDALANDGVTRLAHADQVHGAEVVVRVLHGVDLVLRRGEFAALVGPSGSGKSTFIKLLLKEIDATTGNVQVGGRSLRTLKRSQVPKLRRNIGCVFQDFKLLPTRTVYENVAYALEVQGQRREVIERKVPEIIGLVGLAEKIDKLYRPPKEGENAACPTCGGMGYRGRVGVYELLVINDRMRDLIREKAALSALKAEARKGGMLYMQEEGLRLVVKGITSIDELLRVVK